MNAARRAFLMTVAAVLAGRASHAQGFADLGGNIDGFALPDPAKRFDFPADHGAHPDFRIEWWYLTASLTGADGAAYGVQWTLFRTALKPGGGDGWQSPTLWMGHAALTTATAHRVAERLARGGVGQAGVTTTPFQAWIDEWAMTSQAEPGKDPLDRIALTARGADFGYDLTLQASGPLVAHGDHGYSVKSDDGQSSHYYSQPFYDLTGTITLDGIPVAVTGQGWLDREWSSQPLSPDQLGWDWLSLIFDDGTRLMGYRMRGVRGNYTAASWILPDGTVQALPNGALALTPLRSAEVAGRTLPVEWQVEVPSKGVAVQIKALNDAAWMATSVPYWEGPVFISGSHSGRGYLEMTGY
jgi:predicted secreted hydrolase